MTTFSTRAVPAFRPARALLVVIAMLLFVPGWVAGITWACATWMWAAVEVGFTAGRGIGASDG